MAQAVRVMTVERGIDPRELALLAFGGAGPLHAARDRRASWACAAWSCRVASRRAVGARADRVRAPPRPGRERAARPATALTRDAVAEVVDRLADARPRASSASPGAELRATYDLRYAGQAFELTIDGDARARPGRAARAPSTRAHEERYGYADADAELELVTVRVAVALPGAEPPAARRRPAERARHARGLLRRRAARRRACSGRGEAEVDGPGDRRAARVDAGGAARLARRARTPTGW